MKKGDQLATEIGLASAPIAWHHAIVEWVDYANGKIHVIEFLKFSGIVRSQYNFEDKNWYKVTYNDIEELPADEVVQRAQAQLGKTNYSLLGNNCEHLAAWCKVGKHCSKQVEQGIQTFESWLLAIGC